MKSSKVLCIIAIAVVAVTAAACAKKEAPAETQAQQAETKAAETQAETQAMVGMANPMVEITDGNEFEKQLGIRIEVAKLHDPKPQMFIIDGKLAHVVMKDSNPNGETVEYTLRATKDAELAPSMHGIYDPLQDLSVKDFDLDGKKVTVTEKETKDKKTQVSTWQAGDTYYSLTITGSPSQMQISEVMDSIWAATGVTK